MAAGDFTTFEEFRLQMANGTHDLDTHTFKVALLTSATAPTASDATPQLGDYTEVTAGGNYTAGGYTVTPSWTEAGGTATWDSDDPTWSQHASNPTNARYGLLYNDTATGDPAIGWVDLGTTVDLSASDYTMTVNGSGWFTVS